MNFDSTETLVATPFGFARKSNVHYVDPRHYVRHEFNSVSIITESGVILEKFHYINPANLSQTNDYIFKSKKGKNQPLKRIQAWRILKSVVNAKGLEGKIALHSTRKTFADRMYTKLGKDLIKTAKALGHKNINSTVSYLSFKTEELDNAIESFDD